MNDLLATSCLCLIIGGFMLIAILAIVIAFGKKYRANFLGFSMAITALGVSFFVCGGIGLIICHFK
jgi:ABC-type nickel/cobalt efflux system permease component RcnA